MKRSSGVEGFTILETLIVLAVMGFLLLGAALLIANKQNSTQFSQGVGDVASQLQKVINEVSAGVYPDYGNLTCTAPVGFSAPPILTTGSATHGTNQACMFLGKAIQFSVGSPGSAVFNTYSIVGLRANANGPVTSVAAAHPRVVAESASDPPGAVPDQFATSTMPYGLSVSYIHYNGAQNTRSIGFIPELTSLGADDASQKIDLVAIPGTNPGDSKLNGADHINTSLSALPAADINPSGGVSICLNSGSTNQSALIQIGSGGRDLSVSSVIKDSPNCP